MFKFVIIMTASIVGYGSGTGAGIDVATFELPFVNEAACQEYIKELKKAHEGSNRMITVSCAHAGVW